MRFRVLLLASALGAVSLAPSAGLAQDMKAAGEGMVRDLSVAGVKFGSTGLKAVLQSQPATPFVAPPAPGTASAVISEVVDRYRNDRGRLQGDITMVQGATDAVADIAAATSIAASGGTTAVPVLMIRASFQAATDEWFGAEKAEAEEKVRTYLAKNQDRIVQSAGMSYEELRKLPPEALRERLDRSTTAFRALDQAVSEPALRELGRDLVVSSILNTQKATLDRLNAQGAEIGDLKGSLGRLEAKHEAFAQKTLETLERQETAIANISANVEHLDRTVNRIDTRLRDQERDMAFVQDFMFEKMDPAKKAEVLKAGFMAARFACPGGGSDCDKAQLKADLIERFEAEAALQKAVDTAGSVMRDANGLLQIANDLGIGTGDAGKFVAYGTAAANAFAAAASGNYIGAVASITGMFGRRGSDGQMKFLQAQFKQINKKLDSVLKNQQRLSEQIAGLSKSLDAHVAQLNGRLDTVEQRIQRVRQLQALELNQNWIGCYNLYARARETQARHQFNWETSTFPTFEQASQFAYNYPLELGACSTTISTKATVSLGAADWFGSFLTADTRLGTPDEKLDLIDKDRAAAYRLLEAYAGAQKIPLWRTFQMLASPADDLKTLRERAAAPLPAVSPCAPAGVLGRDRLAKLLCVGTGSAPANPDQSAASGLGVSMVPERAVDVAEWTLLEQALVDLHIARRPDRPLEAMELIKATETKDRATGEEHTEQALLLLDAAMANTAMLQGDLMTLAVVSALTAPASKAPAEEALRLKRLEDARLVLSSHPALARNVANAWLKDRFAIYLNGQRSALKPRAGAYAAALAMAEQNEGEPYAMLNTLFGGGMTYERTPQNQVWVQLMAADASKPDRPAVLAPLPEVLAFENGRLFYPSQVQELAAARERVGTRLIDYQAFRTLDLKQREILVRTLARTVASADPRVERP